MKSPKFLLNELKLLRRYHGHMSSERQLLHLICFKNWTADMVMEVISSAINLKRLCPDTHLTRLHVLGNAKVMILQEVNEPVLKMAVSKAASFLGASDVTIIDHLLWDSDYFGRVFSLMCDVIFVATATQTCVERFAEQSTVPVLCTRSRAQASLQAMATVMALFADNALATLQELCVSMDGGITYHQEEYGSVQNLNIAYIGHPHPVLNSYLLLCPMLGANFKFKCCCEKCPISPLLYKTSQDMTERSHTKVKQCAKTVDVLRGASVIIAGPTSTKSDKIEDFKLNFQDLAKNCAGRWTFFHTCPRGKEVDDYLFLHINSRTFNAFNNMQYIAAALMAKAVIGQKF